ncbi:MAG: hypothetical protein KGL39_15545 [Patescibacteria group bacterium]|nr:hypothetical protein [Patescibacteria group bacterium]
MLLAAQRVAKPESLADLPVAQTGRARRAALEFTACLDPPSDIADDFGKFCDIDD